MNYDQFTSGFDAGGGGSMDALTQLKQLQQQLQGGMQGATAQPMQQQGAGTPMSGAQTQFLGPWYSQQNPYLNAGRAPGTAQQIGAGGQLYDWQAPTDMQRGLMNQWNTGQIAAGPGMNFEQWYLQNGGAPTQMPTMTPQSEWQQVLQQRGLQDPGQQYQYGPGGQATGPGMQNTESNQWFGMPGTFSLPGAGGTGGNPWQGGGGGGYQTPSAPSGPSWNPGDNAVNFIQQLGGQIPDFLSTLNQGQAVGGRGDIGRSLQGLGQFGGGGGVPSPQSLGNLQPSEMQFLQGFFETLLGIPMSDVMGASFAPFQGLRSAGPARRRQNPRR